MQGTEFDTIGGLEQISNGFARASRHPMHIDFGAEYQEGDVASLSQGSLDGDRLGQVEPVDDYHVIWNNRDDRRAYVASERYNLIQHREVVDAIREAVDKTTGSIEKGVIRDYGSHVNGVLVFGDQDDAIIDVQDLVGDGYVPPEGNQGDDAWGPGIRDRLGLGMRFHNSFDGRAGFGGSTMGYRFICQNWMVWGEETVAEKHNYHIKSGDDAPGVPVGYFEDLIYEVFEQRDMLEGTVKRSVEEGEVPMEWVPGLLERAGFGKQYRALIADQLINEYGVDHEGHLTVWDVYNAATHVLDHRRAQDLGPERYDHYQDCAWALVEGEYGRPEMPEEDAAAELKGVVEA